MAVGEGQLWKLTTEGPTTFEIPVPDPIAGQIGLIVMLKANLPAPPPRGGGAGAAPARTGPVAVQLALRLKVVNWQITEAEHVFARIDAPAQVAALQTPRPALLATVPPDKIFGGKLHEIEAMGVSLPLNSKNGWSPFIK